tara:strand:- start:916 stop:1770 length:855 start_codon:yes stop_codon:yes gene_type:complete
MNKLIKQSKGLQIQIIQDWAPENKKIILGHFERKIATFFEAEDKNEQFQNLHKLLIKWAVLTGVKPLPTDDEIRLFVEYIAEHFYRLSLMEIDNAFNLATAGKLDIAAEHYQSFSVIYISNIINAYKRYNGKFILDYRKQLEDEERENNKPSESERMQMMIESILENFENFKKEPKYNHFGYVSYDFLKNLGVIDLKPEIKGILLEQARKMAVEELNEKRKENKHKSERLDIKLEIDEILNDATGKQDLVIRICKNLGLIHYFEFILENNLSLENEITKSMTNG